MTTKRSDIEAVILKLLEVKDEICIKDIAQQAGLLTSKESERKAIQRVLYSLIDQGILNPQGNTRSRTFKLVALKKKKTIFPTRIESNNSFHKIALSNEAKTILKYVSQSPQKRKPVGYNKSFIIDYIPNKTFYLSEKQRADLLKFGKVENKTQAAGTYARNILNRLMIELSWNSSRLEGNTYSLLETKRLIELGENAVGKNATETQMILNHKAAIEYLVEMSSSDEITAHEICSIHALLSENLLGDSTATGKIRDIAVAINGSTYIPLENHHSLQECFDLLVSKLNKIKDPFEQSFFSLVHFSYLQAFEDVNKRTARLVANIPMIKKNLKPLSFTDVIQDNYIKALLGIYEENNIALLRDLYVWAYERSCQKYSAIQQSMSEPNLLKLKFRDLIHQIIRTIIINKVPGTKVVARVKELLKVENLSKETRIELFKVLETEIMSIHDGNFARFKVRPSEFLTWKKLQ